MRLILFTNSYPYGLGEMWKQHEIEILSGFFNELHVIPLHYGGNKIPKKLNLSNVYFHEPLCEFDSYKLTYKDLLTVFFRNVALTNFKELPNILMGLSKDKLIKFLISIKRVTKILKNDNLKKLLNDNNSDMILYFYWGLGSAEILPFFDISKFKKVVVRMHRYDLYEYENNNYIPFRKQLLNKKITILPSSDDGLKHLLSHYPRHVSDLRTQRCGVLPTKVLTTGSFGETLKIVSCSYLVPVKRINLMIASAALLKIPFEWHHIGSGPLETELKDIVFQNNINSFFKFIGKMDSDKIIDYYLKENFDLFINTSRSEGVPFSIMESLSIGIPVIASDAGGTKEIIDNTVGVLLKNNFKPQELSSAIEDYYYLNNEQKNQIRKSAINRYEERCNMEKLTMDFISILRN